MKKRTILAGVLGCLLLCGALAGCSGGDSQSQTVSVVSTYQKGVVEGNVFTSTWMGIQYTAPEDMTMLSQEVLDAGSKDNVQMEMQARREDGSGDNIAMLTEDISTASSIDEAGYVELVKGQMPNGLQDVTFGEVGTRTIAGQDFTELPYTYTRDVNGTKTTMNQILLCKKIEYRMVCITLTLSGENSEDYLLAGFSQI